LFHKLPESYPQIIDPREPFIFFQGLTDDSVERGVVMKAVALYIVTIIFLPVVGFGLLFALAAYIP
jgi:hypothetical protein